MIECTRRSKRFPIFAIAEIVPAGEEEKETVSTMVDNISQHGIGLYSFSPLEKGTKVALRIKFINKDGSEKEDSLSGKIVWSMRYHDLYLIGIAFDNELSPQTNPSLYEYYQSIYSTFYMEK